MERKVDNRKKVHVESCGTLINEEHMCDLGKQGGGKKLGQGMER
jgi:hypothetical protein